MVFKTFSFEAKKEKIWNYETELNFALFTKLPSPDFLHGVQDHLVIRHAASHAPRRPDAVAVRRRAPPAQKILP